MSVKFLLLAGGFWGGGSADLIFMGARIFLIDGPAIRKPNRGDSREFIRANRFAEKFLFFI